MSFARPRVPAARSSVKGSAKKSLSFLNSASKGTVPFKSSARKFEHHNPQKNAGPIELEGRMTSLQSSKHAPANWENLLSSSKTIHEERFTKTFDVRRKTEHSKTNRTLIPDLQDPPIKSPRTTSQMRLKDYFEKHHEGHTERITGCERKHNPKMFSETFEIPYNPKRNKSVNPLNLSADTETINQMFKERNIDKIGIPNATQIKDPTKSIAYRPYFSLFIFSIKTT